jgi:hypothetical protein
MDYATRNLDNLTGARGVARVKLVVTIGSDAVRTLGRAVLSFSACARHKRESGSASVNARGRLCFALIMFGVSA